MRKKKAKLALLGLFLGFSIAFGNMVSIVSTSPAYIVANLEIPSVNTSEEKDITYWWLQPYFVYAAYWVSYVYLDGYEIWVGIWGQSWQDPLIYNERYAVLLSGGTNATETLGMFWNALYQIYDTLVDGYNYKSENIYVLFTDGNFPYEGNTYKSDLDNGIIVTGTPESHKDMHMFPANPLGIYLCLEDLNSRITSDDSLFFWVHDHGDPSNAPESSICLWGNGNFLTDTQLTNCFMDTNFAQAIFVLGECFSGGFLDPGKTSGVKAPGDSNNLLNLNDLAPNGERNVIVMTANDFRPVPVNGITDSFVFPLRTVITPYSYFRTNDQYDFDGWIIGDYDISWEALMTFKGVYREYSVGFRFESDTVMSMAELFHKLEDLNSRYPSMNPQYWESVPGLGARTYL